MINQNLKYRLIKQEVIAEGFNSRAEAEMYVFKLGFKKEEHTSWIIKIYREECD